MKKEKVLEARGASKKKTTDHSYARVQDMTGAVEIAAVLPAASLRGSRQPGGKRGT